MNKKQGIALTLATALSTTTVAGCFGGSDTYEILSATGYSSTYEVDDDFLINEITINVRKNGKPMVRDNETGIIKQLSYTPIKINTYLSIRSLFFIILGVIQTFALTNI